MRFAVWDIEATSLKSDQGFILCCGVKELGKQPKVIGIDQVERCLDPLAPDLNLLPKIRDELERYDGWITWNGKMYDQPYVNDRLTLIQQDLLERRFHIDIMYQARMGRSALTSSRLDWVARALGVKTTKTPLDLSTWKRAEAEARGWFDGGRANYDQVIHHCERDLRVTEQVYERLKPRVQCISK